MALEDAVSRRPETLGAEPARRGRAGELLTVRRGESRTSSARDLFADPLPGGWCVPSAA